MSEPAVNGVFDVAPVIADIIASHCPGTRARHDFVRACIGEDWDDVRAMVEGMLAEPWLLRGYQEARLRQFLELVCGNPHQPKPLRLSPIFEGTLRLRIRFYVKVA